MPLPSETDPQLGLTIRELREEHEVTQKAVARDALITEAALSRIERGVANPTWATVRRLAAAFHLSVAELADRARR